MRRARWSRAEGRGRRDRWAARSSACLPSSGPRPAPQSTRRPGRGRVRRPAWYGLASWSGLLVNEGHERVEIAPGHGTPAVLQVADQVHEASGERHRHPEALALAREHAELAIDL